MLKRNLFFLSMALFVLCNTVMALSVSPVHVYFEPGDRMETVTLNNTSNAPIMLQAQVFQWSEKNGQEIDTPTQDIILSPAMFKVPANSKQLLRIALRNAKMPTPLSQKTYRLIITQIVPKSVQSSEVTPTKGVEEEVFFKLRLLLPIFVEPKIASAKLTVKTTGNSVELLNSGNVTQLISQITWLQGQPLSPIGTPISEFMYLLPGNHHTLTMVPKATTLKVITNQTVELFELN